MSIILITVPDLWAPCYCPPSIHTQTRWPSLAGFTGKFCLQEIALEREKGRKLVSSFYEAIKPGNKTGKKNCRPLSYMNKETHVLNTTLFFKSGHVIS